MKRYAEGWWKKKRDQVGRKNENMIFITMYTLALLGIHALRGIAERWDDEDNSYRPPDRKLPALRIVMMAVIGVEDPNQTIDLATSADEMGGTLRPDPESQVESLATTGTQWQNKEAR